MRRNLPPDIPTLAGRLSWARGTMTKTALAGLAGCSRQFLIALEKGDYKDVGADLAISLSDALKVPIRWLIRGDPLQAYQRIDRDEDSLLRAYRKLSPALREHAQANIASLAAIQQPTSAVEQVAPLPKPPK